MEEATHTFVDVLEDTSSRLLMDFELILLMQLLIMHMLMDCPLLGAAPGSTYGRMLLGIMKR